MLANGSAGLKEFADEAQRLGLVMSTTDAIAADRLGDALDRLKGSVKSLWVSIGSTLAPQAEALPLREYRSG